MNDVELYQMDALNTVMPRFETNQRYLCTFKDGYYFYFVLSFNDKNDDDCRTMMNVVDSFRILKQ